MNKLKYFSIFILMCFISIKNLKAQSYTFNFASGINAISNQINPNQHSLNVNLTNNTTVNLMIYTTSNSITIKEGVQVLYTNNDVVWPTQTSTYPGNKNQLGGRRPNENYWDCVFRNFNNFCCDAVGCAAVVLAPKEVLAGCAIVCGLTTVNHGTITGNSIISITNSNNQRIY